MKTTTGAHIAFCGIDGAGKSTQARLLCGYLRDVVTDIVMHENSRNFVAEVTYTIAHRHGLETGRDFLDEDSYIQVMSFEVLRQNLAQINPFVQRGVTVVSPRTVFDWLAGTRARGCSDLAYKRAEEILLFGGCPALVFWLNTSPSIALERISKRGFDSANLTVLGRLRDEYARLAAQFRMIQIDGDMSEKEVFQQILPMLNTWLTKNTEGL